MSMYDDYLIKIPKNQVICKEGDKSKELYFIVSGKLLICTRKGSMVTPIAYLEEGDYFGEMSFIDGLSRSSDVITIEESQLIKIPPNELKQQLPPWLILTAKNMTSKLRLLNDVIRSKGIKRKTNHEVKALSIEEQRTILELLNRA